jgi:hypothetical protein
MTALSIFFGTSWEDEVAQTPVAPAITPEPKQRRKSFQYAGHYRDDHEYSPFHTSLDVALRHFYGKANLQTVLLKKGLLRYENLYLLDHATVDVWPNVVMVKIPKWIPSQTMAMYQRSPQSFCRFISKRDFLEAIVDYAMLQGHQAIAHACRSDSSKMVVKSSTSGNVYELTPSQHQCECNCPAHQSLEAGFTEDAKMLSLLVAHPDLKKQIPDKHVFSLWATWGVKDFASYQSKQQDWERQQQAIQQYKGTLKACGVALKQTIPGHFDVLNGPNILGSVDRRYDAQDNSWWINQRRISRNSSVPGDHVHYGTAEEAAIALAQLYKVIDDGERAKTDLFGGGWDAIGEERIGQASTHHSDGSTHNRLGNKPDLFSKPYLADEQPEHLIESHTDFIDDVNQEVRSQPVAVASRKKVVRDPFGGFDF